MANKYLDGVFKRSKGLLDCAKPVAKLSVTVAGCEVLAQFANWGIEKSIEKICYIYIIEEKFKFWLKASYKKALLRFAIWLLGFGFAFFSQFVPSIWGIIFCYLAFFAFVSNIIFIIVDAIKNWLPTFYKNRTLIFACVKNVFKTKSLSYGIENALKENFILLTNLYVAVDAVAKIVSTFSFSKINLPSINQLVRFLRKKFLMWFLIQIILYASLLLLLMIFRQIALKSFTNFSFINLIFFPFFHLHSLLA